MARPRFSTYTKKVYNSQSHLKLTQSIVISSQHTTAALEGALHLDITFHMPIKALKLESRQKLEGKPHYHRPDLDNLIKWIADLSMGIIYKDDAIIASIDAKKVYSMVPRTEFSFKKLE